MAGVWRVVLITPEGGVVTSETLSVCRLSLSFLSLSFVFCSAGDLPTLRPYMHLFPARKGAYVIKPQKCRSERRITAAAEGGIQLPGSEALSVLLTILFILFLTFYIIVVVVFLFSFCFYVYSYGHYRNKPPLLSLNHRNK